MNEQTQEIDYDVLAVNWGPKLAKAATNYWPFAICLSNGQIFEAMSATIDGDYITLHEIQHVSPEAQLHHVGFNRGVQIHRSQILWVAEADS